MPSVITIVNLALLDVGSAKIGSLTEDSPEAAAANLVYDEALEYVLEAHDWDFATTRVQLAALSATPAFGYDHQYQLPADFVRLIGAWDNDDETGELDFRIAKGPSGGKVIETDADALYVKYVAKVTDPNVMTPSFRKTLRYELAMPLAIKLHQSSTLADAMEKKRDKALRDARGIDGIQAPGDQIPDGTWITDRDGDSTWAEGG